MLRGLINKYISSVVKDLFIESGNRDSVSISFGADLFSDSSIDLHDLIFRNDIFDVALQPFQLVSGHLGKLTISGIAEALAGGGKITCTIHDVYLLFKLDNTTTPEQIQLQKKILIELLTGSSINNNDIIKDILRSIQRVSVADDPDLKKKRNVFLNWIMKLFNNFQFVCKNIHARIEIDGSMTDVDVSQGKDVPVEAGLNEDKCNAIGITVSSCKYNKYPDSMQKIDGISKDSPHVMVNFKNIQVYCDYNCDSYNTKQSTTGTGSGASNAAINAHVLQQFIDRSKDIHTGFILPFDIDVTFAAEIRHHTGLLLPHFIIKIPKVRLAVDHCQLNVIKKLNEKLLRCKKRADMLLRFTYNYSYKTTLPPKVIKVDGTHILPSMLINNCKYPASTGIPKNTVAKGGLVMFLKNKVGADDSWCKELWRYIVTLVIQENNRNKPLGRWFEIARLAYIRKKYSFMYSRYLKQTSSSYSIIYHIDSKIGPKLVCKLFEYEMVLPIAAIKMFRQLAVMICHTNSFNYDKKQLRDQGTGSKYIAKPYEKVDITWRDLLKVQMTLQDVKLQSAFDQWNNSSGNSSSNSNSNSVSKSSSYEDDDNASKASRSVHNTPYSSNRKSSPPSTRPSPTNNMMASVDADAGSDAPTPTVKMKRKKKAVAATQSPPVAAVPSKMSTFSYLSSFTSIGSTSNVTSSTSHTDDSSKVTASKKTKSKSTTTGAAAGAAVAVAVAAPSLLSSTTSLIKNVTALSGISSNDDADTKMLDGMKLTELLGSWFASNDDERVKEDIYKYKNENSIDYTLYASPGVGARPSTSTIINAVNWALLRNQRPLTLMLPNITYAIDVLSFHLRLPADAAISARKNLMSVNVDKVLLSISISNQTVASVAATNRVGNSNNSSNNQSSSEVFSQTRSKSGGFASFLGYFLQVRTSVDRLQVCMHVYNDNNITSSSSTSSSSSSNQTKKQLTEEITEIVSTERLSSDPFLLMCLLIDCDERTGGSADLQIFLSSVKLNISQTALLLLIKSSTADTVVECRRRLGEISALNRVRSSDCLFIDYTTYTPIVHAKYRTEQSIYYMNVEGWKHALRQMMPNTFSMSLSTSIVYANFFNTSILTNYIMLKMRQVRAKAYNSCRKKKTKSNKKGINKVGLGIAVVSSFAVNLNGFLDDIRTSTSSVLYDSDGYDLDSTNTAMQRKGFEFMVPRFDFVLAKVSTPVPTLEVTAFGVKFQLPLDDETIIDVLSLLLSEVNPLYSE